MNNQLEHIKIFGGEFYDEETETTYFEVGAIPMKAWQNEYDLKKEITLAKIDIQIAQVDLQMKKKELFRLFDKKRRQIIFRHENSITPV